MKYMVDDHMRDKMDCLLKEKEQQNGDYCCNSLKDLGCMVVGCLFFPFSSLCDVCKNVCN